MTTRGGLVYGLWLGMLLGMLAGCGGTAVPQAMPIQASPTQVPQATIRPATPTVPQATSTPLESNAPAVSGHAIMYMLDSGT